MRTTSKPSRISRQAQNHLTGRESTVLRLAPRTQWRSTAPVTPAAKVFPHDAASCHQQGATPSSRRQSSSDSNTNTARVSMPVRASLRRALPRKLSGDVPVRSTTRCPDRSRPPRASCAATGAPVSSKALCDTQAVVSVSGMMSPVRPLSCQSSTGLGREARASRARPRLIRPPVSSGSASRADGVSPACIRRFSCAGHEGTQEGDTQTGRLVPRAPLAVIKTSLTVKINALSHQAVALTRLCRTTPSQTSFL